MAHWTLFFDEEPFALNWIASEALHRLTPSASRRNKNQGTREQH
jgi:hypothetical protein